ncbi:MAG: type IX secretion system membrane protein PorP/SprF [Saprospiraceae bacterium]|nr:MAG: type IX secretion system membrane protein PorP/SprF [Saprospiraceae bacterium]
MRLTKTLLLSLATFAFVTHVHGQDLHNSLFYMNPLHINPAFTGAYEGTYRLGGLYRDQTRSVVTNAYSTPSFFIDAPVVMVGKRHWVGVGGLMFQDQAGDGKLKTTSFQLSGSFHLSLDKKSNNVLTLGVQWGKVQRTLKNVGGLEFADYLEQVQSGVANPSTDDEVVGQTGGGPSSGKAEPKKDYSDINGGLLFSSKVNNNTNFNIGFSMRHITTPRYDFKSTVVDLPVRLTAHAQLNTPLTGKWSLTPEVYYTNIDPASQFQVHAWTGYLLKPEKNIKLNFGLGYRSNDAGQVLLGMDYGSLKAALAYDVTLSSLNEANNYKGGFEIAVYYIGKIYKKPVVKPVIIGPHL